MPCTCNAICTNDCASNTLCTGHVPACSNSFSFTSIGIGTIILASHLRELESAIDNERNDSGRRFNASEPSLCSLHTPGDLACTNNDFSSYGFSGGEAGEIIRAQDYDDVKDANNEVTNDSGYGVLVTGSFVDQASNPITSVIYAVAIADLQTKINQTRNVCICDSHCNCDPSDCGCNGECPSDDYYSTYYP
jgi:hypothetical protein